MQNRVRQTRVCPICNQAYKDHPAISRTDNETLICPTCGTRQALQAMGLKKEEIDEIIKLIPLQSEKEVG